MLGVDTLNEIEILSMRVSTTSVGFPTSHPQPCIWPCCVSEPGGPQLSHHPGDVVLLMRSHLHDACFSYLTARQRRAQGKPQKPQSSGGARFVQGITLLILLKFADFGVFLVRERGGDEVTNIFLM